MPFLPSLRSWADSYLRDTELFVSRQIDKLKLVYLDVLMDSDNTLQAIFQQDVKLKELIENVGFSLMEYNSEPRNSPQQSSVSKPCFFSKDVAS